MGVITVHRIENFRVCVSGSGSGFNVLPGESLRIGGTLRRECVVTSPGFRVYWIKPDKSRVDSRSLTIDNLQPSHSGKYTCYGENTSTGAKFWTWFTIDMSQSKNAFVKSREVQTPHFTSYTVQNFMGLKEKPDHLFVLFVY